MSVSIIDGFKLNTSLPIDDRIIASNSTTRNLIPYKYNGMSVFQLDNRITYIWNESISSWDIDNSVSGQGTTNHVSKWDSSIGLTDSSVVSNPRYYNEINQKIGIGGSPEEAFQVNSNFLTYSNYLGGVGTSSPPFVVHKGSSTIIGENWYQGDSTIDRVFDPNFSSSVIKFSNSLEFKGRTAGSIATMSSIFNISNGYIGFTNSSSLPSDGSIYFNNRMKVTEGIYQRDVSNSDTYSILLSQTGLNAPIQTLLESTIGNGTWSYISIGVYNLSIDNGFTSAISINGFCGPYTSTSVFFGQKISSNLYQIRTLSSVGGSLVNSVLNNTFLEIKFT